jgi:hypothetical protein
VLDEDKDAIVGDVELAIVFLKIENEKNKIIKKWRT